MISIRKNVGAAITRAILIRNTTDIPPDWIIDKVLDEHAHIVYRNDALSYTLRTNTLHSFADVILIMIDENPDKILPYIDKCVYESRHDLFRTSYYESTRLLDERYFAYLHNMAPMWYYIVGSINQSYDIYFPRHLHVIQQAIDIGYIKRLTIPGKLKVVCSLYPPIKLV